MIRIILCALALGIFIGVLGLAPGIFVGNIDPILTVMLCALLFVIGLDMSQNKSVVSEIKRMGLKIIGLPIFIAVGSILGALAIGIILGIKPANAMAIGAGFGWYSLSGVMLTSLVGAQIGTMALLTNVFREVLSIVMLPFVVKYFGKIVAVAPGRSHLHGHDAADHRALCGQRGQRDILRQRRRAVDPRDIPRAGPCRALNSTAAAWRTQLFCSSSLKNCTFVQWIGIYFHGACYQKQFKSIAGMVLRWNVLAKPQRSAPH